MARASPTTAAVGLQQLGGELGVCAGFCTKLRVGGHWGIRSRPNRVTLQLIDDLWAVRGKRAGHSFGRGWLSPVR